MIGLKLLNTAICEAGITLNAKTVKKDVRTEDKMPKYKTDHANSLLVSGKKKHLEYPSASD